MTKEACGTCGAVDDGIRPGVHLCSGMRPVGTSADFALSPDVANELRDFLDDADRCRAEAAVGAMGFFLR